MKNQFHYTRGFKPISKNMCNKYIYIYIWEGVINLEQPSV